MKTILYIEDNDEIRETTSLILELAGYKVLATVNNKEGIAVAMEQKPDLIVCDIILPETDGYSMIHLLQNNKGTQSMPFILLADKNIEEQPEPGNYVPKRLSGRELLHVIEKRLEKSEMLKEELSPGITGFDTLINVTGKQSFKNFGEDRVINKFSKKQKIYREGDTPHRLFCIQKGKVKTYKTNDDGKDLVTNLYNEGDFFGYLALLEGGVYKESAEAIEDSEIAVIPKQDFEKLVSSDSEIMQKFIKLLANNISDNETQLLNLAYNSLRKRVANSLVMLYNKYKNENDTPFVIDMSRENLANIAGTAKESLIRMLSDFKNEQLIGIKGGEITILDENKLRNLLG